MLKADSLAIAAIFRDEYDYLLEWFAWHQIAGFKRFFIADNGSTDGTVALLEALGDLGIVNLIYQPVLLKRSQPVAYQRLSQGAMSCGIESVLFIDADEFLVHESMTDGEEYRCLLGLLMDPKVAMVGMNWRTFGSSGHKLYSSEPVLSRFTKCCGEMELSRNGPLKSISKLAYVTSIGPHVSVTFPGYRSVDGNGANLGGFVMYADAKAVDVQTGSALRYAIDSPLRVNHYVIKSEQEFNEKKRRRGSAMRGIGFDKGEGYFSRHDFTDATFIFPESKIIKLKQEIIRLQSLLEETAFIRRLRGALDLSNSTEVRGWLVDEHKQSSGLHVNIFVNDVWHAQVSCGFYRSDLKEKNISANGLSGFRFTHPKPLAPGDVVDVKVHANRYVFPGGGRAFITELPP